MVYSDIVSTQSQEKHKMLAQKERIIIWVAICISAIAIAAAVMLAIIGRQSDEDIDVVHHHEPPPSESLTASTRETAETDVEPAGGASC